MPTVKKRGSKTFGGEKNDDKKPRPRRNNRRNNQKRNHTERGNVYESNKSTTVRRRSRKIDSGAARPGQNSSGLRK